MLKILIIIFLFFPNVLHADTDNKIYSCNENKNKLYVLFNHNNKTVMIGMGEQKKYSVQIDFIYWDTVSYQNNDTLFRSIIFHKPTGRMYSNEVIILFNVDNKLLSMHGLTVILIYVQYQL